jgi:aspartate racemase
MNQNQGGLIMLRIGLIGGMSWESSIEYYRIINQLVQKELGGVHSAKIVMISLDFAEIEEMQNRGDWDLATQILVDSAKSIEGAGADFVLICTNTMHLMADEVQRGIGIPLLHIADATAKEVIDQHLNTVGLLGTRFTMEKEFYRGRLENKHGLKVLIPEEEQREKVHRVIYDELVKGAILDESRLVYNAIIQNLVELGAEGIILGCTEIGLLVREEDIPVPVFDTMEIHARAAVEAALGRFPLRG